MDENYLYEFRQQGRLHHYLYQMWWLTSDCGRSFLRWAAFTLWVIIIFATLYCTVNIDYGEHPTGLSPLYFSVVTLTTLGYGDAVPASLPAQVIAILEVLCGYMLLGGLLSIFANKMARRAE